MALDNSREINILGYELGSGLSAVPIILTNLFMSKGENEYNMVVKKSY